MSISYTILLWKIYGFYYRIPAMKKLYEDEDDHEDVEEEEEERKGQDD